MKTIRILCFAIILIQISYSFAENASVHITKEVWLEKMKNEIAIPTCKSFINDASIKAQLDLQHISYQSCLAIIPKIFEDCAKQNDSAIPALINTEEAKKIRYDYGRMRWRTIRCKIFIK